MLDHKKWLQIFSGPARASARTNERTRARTSERPHDRTNEGPHEQAPARTNEQTNDTAYDMIRNTKS